MPAMPPHPGAADTLRQSPRPCRGPAANWADNAPDLLGTCQLTLRIAAIVAVIEGLVMFGLPHVLPAALQGTWIESLTDVLLLSLISMPLMRLWVVRPFVLARNAAIAHAQELASTDPLTRLANRRQLIETLDAFITGLATPRRGQAPGALLLLDLDGFKPVNDRYGHEAGDRVLVEVAQRLHTLSGGHDLPARLGGDEFVVLLQRLTPDPVAALREAETMAQRVASLLAEPIDYGGHTLQVGVSIGVRLIDTQMDCDTALREADQALYLAKHTGKGRVVFFDAMAREPLVAPAPLPDGAPVVV